MEDLDIINHNASPEKPSYFKKGSNPFNQTARGKLQSKRSKLNDDIIKELRIRAGAENLLRATSNKKVKETVSVELGFVNSKLQVLKNELAQLNSSVEVYQHAEGSRSIPMIPLGLKETREVFFSQPFQDFIEVHYCEKGSEYAESIKELECLREAVRTPARTIQGVELLYQYYNQLWFVDKRIYAPGQGSSVYFHWYDSLTGVPTAQRTIGYEKGNVLFNIGALFTQLAAKQDQTTVEGLEGAVDLFQKASGVFKYLRDRFANAPSKDMKEDALTMYMQLMLSQAQECAYEKHFLNFNSNAKLHGWLERAQEAAMVAHMYEKTNETISTSAIKVAVPVAWTTITKVKFQYYMALSHYYVAMGLLKDPTTLESSDATEMQKLFDEVHLKSPSGDSSKEYQRDPSKAHLLSKGHLKEAVMLHEDALRDHGLNKSVKQIGSFFEILRVAKDRTLMEYSRLEDENDFSEIFLAAPHINPKSTFLVKLVLPEFKSYPVEDLFHKLGPINVFNAKQQWSAPKLVTLTKQPTEGFGFYIQGDRPSYVSDVVDGSIAQVAGLQPKDILVAVRGVDSKRMCQTEIKELILTQPHCVNLAVVTPVTDGAPTVRSSTGSQDNTIRSATSSSSGAMRLVSSGSGQYDVMTDTMRKKLGHFTFLKKKDRKGSSREK